MSDRSNQSLNYDLTYCAAERKKLSACVGNNLDGRARLNANRLDLR